MNYITPNWPAPKQIKARTTLRQAWGDKQQFPEREPAVIALKTLLQLPEVPILINQKHTAIALEALAENKEKIADALFTTQANRVCMVLTADCLPLLVCNKAGTQVAAIHAGWRGLAAGVIEATLANFSDAHEDLMVWLGPAITAKNYEVGSDVYDAFVSRHALSANAFSKHIPGKWFADLYALAKVRLQLLGITEIYGGDFCTYTQDDLFFSNRRDKGIKGNIANIIWISN